jgi:UDP:flavonoid glycosyltransferase YjiC (YdhE family)
VVEAGAGLRIAPNRCTPERLRAAVERVMNEPSFRDNARRLAGAFARSGGPARAAQLLEGLSATYPEDSKLRKGVSLASN